MSNPYPAELGADHVPDDSAARHVADQQPATTSMAPLIVEVIAGNVTPAIGAKLSARFRDAHRSFLARFAQSDRDISLIHDDHLAEFMPPRKFRGGGCVLIGPVSVMRINNR